MEENQTQGMPIAFQMALAHNKQAFNCFLKLDNKSQDELISKAQKLQSKREIQLMVDNIPRMHL